MAVAKLMIPKGGILIYRTTSGQLEVLLGHPGGPYYSKKDHKTWTILKGTIHPNETYQAGAIREFCEESGLRSEDLPKLYSLGSFQNSHRTICYVWAGESDFDEKKLKSNNFTMEYPAHSEVRQEYPEIDKFQYFTIAEAQEKISSYQVALLYLVQQLYLELQEENTKFLQRPPADPA